MSPSTLIILLLSTACAAAAHLVWGRRWLQLLIFWIVAFVACLLVYATSLALPLPLPRPAGVPLLECAVAAWMLLLVVSRLRL